MVIARTLSNVFLRVIFLLNAFLSRKDGRLNPSTHPRPRLKFAKLPTDFHNVKTNIASLDTKISDDLGFIELANVDAFEI